MATLILLIVYCYRLARDSRSRHGERGTFEVLATA